MPQSVRGLPYDAVNDGPNKRRKINNYSSWMQESFKSISPETTAASLPQFQSLASGGPMSFLSNMTPLSDTDESHKLRSDSFNIPGGQSAPVTANLSVTAEGRAPTTGHQAYFMQNEDDTFLERMLSAKRVSQLTGIAARPAGAKIEVPAKAAPKEPPKADEKSWEFMYNRLLKHMSERGIDKVPTRIHMDPELRTWVAQQRLDFKKRNLNSERQFLLRSIGFYRDKFTLKWDAKFERLKDFKKEHGHTNVPFHYTKDRQLGTWVSKQRVRIRQGTISEEEKVRLEAIGFVPNRFNARWEEMFRRLVAYKKIYGDANVPRVYEKDPQLAQWVLNQKDAFREGKMKPERQIKLEAIGFSWSTFYEGDLEWEGNFQKLIAYKSMHGHVRFFKDPKLARWVALQQSLQSMGTLDPKRMDLLISVEVLPVTALNRTISQLGQQQAPSSAMPPMGLRQSFSEWNTSGSTSNFL
jgi:hypothetical protein